MSYMKTKITAVLLCIFLLASCSGEKDTEELLGQVEQYTKETAEVSGYAYQKELGAWLAPETNYHYEEADDRSDYLINLFSGTYDLRKNRLYFTIDNKVNENAERAEMLAYISLKTGEKHYLCPDPLCPHTDDSGCQYRTLDPLMFAPGSDTVAYFLRSVYINDIPSKAICEINLEDNTIREVYRPAEITDTKISFNWFRLQFFSGNNLYFSDTNTYQYRDEKGMDYAEEKSSLKVLNLTDGTVKTVQENYAPNARCLYSADGKLYFVNQLEGRFYVMNEDFTEERNIMVFEENEQMSAPVYDTHENAFYFTTGEGLLTLWRVDADLSCEQVPLPSEEVNSVQLTDNYIYYTVYDPVVYGTSPRGGASIDVTGSKIYRTPRSNPTEGELVFDGKGELFFMSYIVTGNYLYLDHCSLIEEGGLAWFRRMGSTMRVNFAEGTLKWLNLD